MALQIFVCQPFAFLSSYELPSFPLKSQTLTPVSLVQHDIHSLLSGCHMNLIVLWSPHMHKTKFYFPLLICLMSFKLFNWPKEPRGARGDVPLSNTFGVVGRVTFAGWTLLSQGCCSWEILGHLTKGKIHIMSVAWISVCGLRWKQKWWESFLSLNLD